MQRTWNPRGRRRARWRRSPACSASPRAPSRGNGSTPAASAAPPPPPAGRRLRLRGRRPSSPPTTTSPSRCSRSCRRCRCFNLKSIITGTHKALEQQDERWFGSERERETVNRFWWAVRKNVGSCFFFVCTGPYCRICHALCLLNCKLFFVIAIKELKGFLVVDSPCLNQWRDSRKFSWYIGNPLQQLWSMFLVHRIAAS